MYIESNNAYRHGNGNGGNGNDRRVEDTTFELRVSLETVYRGLPVSVDYPGGRQVQCDICHGEGGVGPGGVQKCTTCGGSGVQTMRFQVAPGYYQTMRQQYTS
jgi:DnaJ-related protein SCJ1